MNYPPDSMSSRTNRQHRYSQVVLVRSASPSAIARHVCLLQAYSAPTTTFPTSRFGKGWHGMFLLLILATNIGAQEVNQCGLSLPNEIGEWRAVEEDASYDRATLYDYMNGGAEVYLSFDYRRVCVRRFLGPDDGEIALDVYDMGSSAEAFGVFSVSIEDPEVGIGQGSEFGAGLLKFWKDKFFVSIVNMGVDESADRMLLEIGRAVDAAIPSTGPAPEMLSMLPSDGLNERQTSYFHSNVILSNRFFVAAENVLRLTDETDCVFGEYGEVGDAGSLLIVQYANEEAAQEGHSSFIRGYLPETDGLSPHQTENGNWTYSRRTGEFVSIVFEAPSAERAIELQSSIEFN